MKTSTSFHFRNWARNQQCRAEKYFQPATETELIAIVKNAAALGKKIRMVGAGHSWSDVVLSDDFLVNLDDFCQPVKLDLPKMQVTVQAGMRLKQLHILLEKNGMAMRNLGSVSEQSIAGAISTGTHGTGIQYPILSTQVIGLRVIHAAGEIVEIGEEHPLLDAYRLSLGTLGIISEVTLQCTAFFHLKENAAPMNFDEAVRQLPELLQTNDHLKFWWFPHVNFIQVYRYNRTHEPLNTFSAAERWMRDSFLAQYVFSGLLKTGKTFPAIIPRVNRFINTLHFKTYERIDKCYRVFNVAMPPRHRESEIAIPVEQAGEALLAMRQMIEREKLFINFVVEARFVKADDCWLSPAYQRDSCYIGAYQHCKQWDNYLQAFELLMKNFHGRPHWGKEFTPARYDFQSLYPKWNDFLKLHHETDPEDRFGNRFTNTVFNLPSRRQIPSL